MCIRDRFGSYVKFQVPTGGDYSGMNLEIDSDNQVSFCLEVEEEG